MDLEEIKRRYPVGTIFNPAHISTSDEEKLKPQYQIEVKEGDTFEKYVNSNDINLVPGDNRSLPWVGNVYYNGKLANIVKLGDVIEYNPITGLPKYWMMEVTSESRELAEKWRQTVQNGYREIQSGEVLLSKHENDTSYFTTYTIREIKEERYYKDRNYQEITFEQFKNTFFPEQKGVESLRIDIMDVSGSQAPPIIYGTGGEDVEAAPFPDLFKKQTKIPQVEMIEVKTRRII